MAEYEPHPDWVRAKEEQDARNAEVSRAFHKAPPPTTEELLGYLKHPYPEMRTAAVARVAKRPPNPEFFDLLKDMLDDPGMPYEKHYLIEALTVYGQQAETPLLYLLQDDWWENRKYAARALAQIGTPAALPSLDRLWATDLSECVRSAALDAIKEIQSRHAV